MGRRKVLTGGVIAFSCLLAVAVALPTKRPVRVLPKPRFRIDKICWVHDNVQGQCYSRTDLNRVFSPDQIARIDELFQMLYEQLSLDKGKKGVTACGQSAWGTFSPGAGPAKGRTRGSAASSIGGLRGPVSDFASAVSACRQSIAADVGLQNLSPGADFQTWVSGTVAQVDRQVANCRDAGNSAIAAAADTASPTFRPSELLKTSFGGRTVELSEGGYFSLYLTVLKAVQDTENEIGKKEQEARENPDRAAGQKQLAKLEEEKSYLLEVVEDLVTWFQQLLGDTPAPPPRGTPAAVTDASSQPPTSPPPQVTSPPAPSTSPVPSSSSTGRPCSPGVDCGGRSCADIQAAWQWFKQMCDASGWQTYNCVAFLRKVNGCVDASKIYTSPDGDLTCPTRTTKAEGIRLAYLEQCRRRKWVMMPVPGQTITCVAPDLNRNLPIKFDPCNDPRAMPSEDQCTGVAPLPGPQPNPPQPNQPDH